MESALGGSVCVGELRKCWTQGRSVLLTGVQAGGRAAQVAAWTALEQGSPQLPCGTPTLHGFCPAPSPQPKEASTAQNLQDSGTERRSCACPPTSGLMAQGGC